MKQLLITRMKDSLYMVPPEKRMEVMLGSGAFVDKYRKEGKCKEIYVVPGLKMSVTIWEVESAEELDRLFLEWPAFPFADVEVYALADFDTYMKGVKERYQTRAKK